MALDDYLDQTPAERLRYLQAKLQQLFIEYDAVKSEGADGVSVQYAITELQKQIEVLKVEVGQQSCLSPFWQFRIER